MRCFSAVAENLFQLFSVAVNCVSGRLGSTCRSPAKVMRPPPPLRLVCDGHSGMEGGRHSARLIETHFGKHCRNLILNRFRNVNYTH